MQFIIGEHTKEKNIYFTNRQDSEARHQILPNFSSFENMKFFHTVDSLNSNNLLDEVYSEKISVSKNIPKIQRFQ
jgi:hypothetical protein